jgi:hypothetical protein
VQVFDGRREDLNPHSNRRRSSCFAVSQSAIRS